MARWAFERLDPRPVEGQRVQVHGKVTLYDKRAELSLRADRIEPAGDGALLARIEEARRRLDADGLFDARAQAPAAALAARHRPDRRPRRGRAARRHPQRARPPPLGALRAGRDRGAGRARRARDPARAGRARRARRRRRDRDHARRRLARGPAAVLRRGALPRDRGLRDGRRLGRRARARRAAVRPRRRPPRLDADRRRAPDRARRAPGARERRAAALERPALRRARRRARAASASRRSPRGRRCAAPTTGSSRGARRSRACASVLDGAPQRALAARAERADQLVARLRAVAPAGHARARLRHRDRRAAAHAVRDAAALAAGERVDLRLARGGAGARIEEVRADG